MTQTNTLIAVIDYGAGNLHSVEKALRHVITESQIDAQVERVSDAAQLAKAAHILLPGVGAFADCMRGLQALPGMIVAMEKRVREDKVPFLGICVGMQMLFERGHEHGVHSGLGWIEGEVVALTPKAHRLSEEPATTSAIEARSLRGAKEPEALNANNKSLKIPHMGWNDLCLTHTENSVMQGIQTGDHAYFVHSYHCRPTQREDIVATVDYGGEVVAAIQRGNIMAAQFHPEKSQQTGLRLLKNFVLMPSPCLYVPKK